MAKNNSKFRRRGKNKSGKNSDFLFYLIFIPEPQNYQSMTLLCLVFTMNDNSSKSTKVWLMSGSCHFDRALNDGI